MAGPRIRDVFILLPGITGSVLARRDSRDPQKTRDVWNLSASALWTAATSLGSSIRELQLASDDDDDGVVATRLVPDATIIPRLWKIDGYGKVAKYLVGRLRLEPGRNFFEFPYDWRRDNRIAAAQLETRALDWLRAWRESSGAAKARLVLVGHSMGGIVSRYFLECLGGWQHTRALFTFGTPYRGSLNAVDFLVHGMKKGIGPLGLDLTPLLRSFTSVYQLLPTYACIETGTDGPAYVAAAAAAGQLPHVHPQRAAAAHAFHKEIADAQAANAQSDAYRERGYRIFPIVGIEQPTYQSARASAGDVEMLRTFEEEDMGGDGTVPRVSATPIELSDAEREIYAAECHASLQNADGVLANLRGILTRPTIDLKRFRRAPLGITLTFELEDAVIAPEPALVRVRPSEGNPRLSAQISNVETGQVTEDRLSRSGDGWQEVTFDLAPGTYRVRISGGEGVQPVTDLFVVGAAL